jgi:hypothetical protein
MELHQVVDVATVAAELEEKRATRTGSVMAVAASAEVAMGAGEEGGSVGGGGGERKGT